VDVLNGPIVILGQADCEVLGRQLAKTLQLAYGAPGRPAPPRHLLSFAAELNRITRGSGEYRENTQVRTGRGTGEFRAEPSSQSCDQPVWLTVQEAARVAEVSPSYMRRVIRKGDVEASQGHRSAYLVDTSSLAVWISQRERREDHDHKVA
jgi:hypothetical protein